MALLDLTPAQLRRAADLREQIDQLQRELGSLLGTGTTAAASGKPHHWTQTPEGKARMARMVRASWRRRGKRRSSGPAKANGAKKLHWTQTRAGRARLAAMVRKSWQTRRG